MKRFGIVAVCLLLGLCPQPALAQNICPPPVEWDRAFGTSDEESPYAIIQTRDGGYLVGGASTAGRQGMRTSPNYGGADFWIVRLDASGRVLWDRSYGGTANDGLLDLKETPDGGFILGGESSSPPSGNKTSPTFGPAGYGDYWVVRVDANGEPLWDRSFGVYARDRLESVVVTSDGGFLLGGWSECWEPCPSWGNRTSPSYGGGDYWIIKLDANGERLWERTFGGVGGEELHAVRQTPDGGFILGGYSGSQPSGNKTSPNFDGPHYGDTDYWVVRVDADGNKLWDWSYGGYGFDTLWDLEVTQDGGFVLAGYSECPVSGNKTTPRFGGEDFWVVRIDGAGNILWQTSAGGYQEDVAYTVRQTHDGGFVVAGKSASEPGSGSKSSPHFGNRDFWVVRLDANGRQLWEQSYGGTSLEAFIDLKLVQTQDRGFIMAGSSYSGISGNRTSPSLGAADFWIVKLAAEIPEDCDYDGVPDARDQCPDTVRGALVNTNGCSISQLCPCGGTESHVQYVNCVKEAATELLSAGLVTQEQRQLIVQQARATNCPPVIDGDAIVAFGLVHTAISNAIIHPDPFRVEAPEPNATYGASVQLGKADGGLFVYPDGPWGDFNPEWFMEGRAYGRLLGGSADLIATMRVAKPDYEVYPVQIDLSPLQPESLTFQVFSNRTLIAQATTHGPVGSLTVISFPYLAPRGNPFWRMRDGSVGALIEFTAEGVMIPDPEYGRWFVIEGPFGTVRGDRIFIRADQPLRRPEYVSRVDVMAGGGLGSFPIVDERLGMFGHAHQALGPVLLDSTTSGLAVVPLTDVVSDRVGVLIEADHADHLEVDFLPLEFSGVESVFYYYLLGTGLVESHEEGDLTPVREMFAPAALWLEDGALRFTVDFTSVLPPDEGPEPVYLYVELTAFRNGIAVGRWNIPGSNLYGTFTSRNNKVPEPISFVITRTPNGIPSVGLGFGRQVSFTASDGSEARGNHFRFTPVDPARRVLAISDVTVATTRAQAFTIIDERSQAAPGMLSIAADARQVVLSWPDNTGLSSLESSVSLSGGFTVVTNEVDFIEGCHVVVLPVEEVGARFFRLKR